MAAAFEKVTAPKFANGRTPRPDDGASAIHSADESCSAELPAAFVV